MTVLMKSVHIMCKEEEESKSMIKKTPKKYAIYLTVYDFKYQTTAK